MEFLYVHISGRKLELIAERMGKAIFSKKKKKIHYLLSIYYKNLL